MGGVLSDLPRKIGSSSTAVDQWEQRLRDLLEPLDDVVTGMLLDAVSLGVEHGQDVIEGEILGLKRELSFNWHLVNEAAKQWARLYAGQFIKDFHAATLSFIRKDIEWWIENREPLGALVLRLSQNYAFSRSRAWAIASTEVTRAFAYANREAYRASGVVDGLQWVTANDERVCPICAPLGGLVFDDGEAEPATIEEQERRGQQTGLFAPFAHPGGRGAAGRFSGQTFELPPAHPRCRCSISPVINL